MGFATSVNSLVSAAIAYAANLFSDFWPLLAVFVGLMALGYIVGIFKP